MKIKMTKADLMHGELHEPGWYKGNIIWATNKLSKDKGSMNYEYGIEYETGSKVPGLEKREIKGQFNSKGIGFIKPFLAAVAGKSIKEFVDSCPETFEFDWDDTFPTGQKLQFRIENKPREDNGQLTSKITDYVPFDYKVPF